MGQLKVLVADDHAILRFGLKRLIAEMPEVQVIGEADNATTVQDMLREEHWDLLLLDLDMPGQDPLEMLKRVKPSFPSLAVLILSMFPEEQFALRAFKCGAAGYLNKASAPEKLLLALRQLAGGGTYMSAAIAVALINSHAKPLDSSHDVLSDREFAVLRGIAAGKPNTQIAGQLNLSAKTVSTYRSRLLAKLGFKSNVELARYAAAQHLMK